MESINHFTNILPDGRELKTGQEDNGLHYGQIRNRDGEVESAITCKTGAEVNQWLKVQTEMKPELYLHESEQSSSDMMILYRFEEVYKGHGIYISDSDNVTVIDPDYDRVVESASNVLEAKQLIDSGL